jgi:hypothetical protein
LQFQQSCASLICTNTSPQASPSEIFLSAKESPYFTVLFWTAIGIVQISEPKLFSAAVSLMEVTLKMQDYSEGFGKKGVEQLYMGAREGPIDQILTKLDQISGLGFKSSFSFAIAGNLLKVSPWCIVC